MAAGKICAIVGNGFSIDFIEKLKLGHAIRLRGSLIPCPLVFDRDKWNGPWDPPDFQAHRSLHNEWNRLGMPALPENEAWWRFCELLSLDNIAPLGSTFDLIRDQKRYRLIPAGYWGKPFPPGYDLRLYLWRLFATYDRIVLEQLVNQHRDVPQRMKYLEQLPLAPLLRHAAKNHRLRLISYNYDVWLENLVHRWGRKPHAPTVHALKTLQTLGDHEVAVIKPHGSVAFYHPCDRPPPPSKDNVIWSGVSYSRAIRYQYPLEEEPGWPDLLPPGHGPEHFYNTDCGISEAAKIAVREADILIIYGFSARPPDLVEARGLIDCFQGKHAMVVDTNANTHATNLLYARVGKDRCSYEHPDQQEKLIRKLDELLA